MKKHRAKSQRPKPQGQQSSFAVIGGSLPGWIADQLDLLRAKKHAISCMRDAAAPNTHALGYYKAAVDGMIETENLIKELCWRAGLTIPRQPEENPPLGRAERRP